MEKIETYYIPSHRKQIARGKLYDCYNNTRARLNALGVIKRRETNRFNPNRIHGEWMDASNDSNLIYQQNQILNERDDRLFQTPLADSVNDDITVLKQDISEIDSNISETTDIRYRGSDIGKS